VISSHPMGWSTVMLVFTQMSPVMWRLLRKVARLTRKGLLRNTVWTLAELWSLIYAKGKIASRLDAVEAR